MKSAVIIGGARTATGKFGKTLAETPAPRLGAAALSSALEKSGLAPEDVDEVIIGAHFQAGLRSNPARQAALYAGLPDTVTAFTPNMNCATALKAVQLAAQSIMTGESRVVAAGGCENMSGVPYILTKARFGYRMGQGELLDGMLYDGLVDSFIESHMGVTAENVAKRYNVSRERQDQFALRSHTLSEAAWNAGKYDGDIAPVEIRTRHETTVFTRDETYIEGAGLERFSGLKPVFLPDGGTVTAGNASPISDGAAVLVLADEAFAKERGRPVLARYVAGASAATDPAYMGYAPVYAVRKLLAKTGLSISDICLWEVNEAFAAQAVAVCRDLAIPENRVNVNGGSIALGHPVGATGARLCLTLINELRRRGGRYGIVTLCIGGGQALAVLFENDV